MAMNCGCKVGPGELVSAEMLRAHARHTFEALIFWDLVVGLPKPEKVTLMEARLKVQTLLDVLAPDWQEV